MTNEISFSNFNLKDHILEGKARIFILLVQLIRTR